MRSIGCAFVWSILWASLAVQIIAPSCPIQPSWPYLISNKDNSALYAAFNSKYLWKKGFGNAFLLSKEWWPVLRHVQEMYTCIIHQNSGPCRTLYWVKLLGKFPFHLVFLFCSFLVFSFFWGVHFLCLHKS